MNPPSPVPSEDVSFSDDDKENEFNDSALVTSKSPRGRALPRTLFGENNSSNQLPLVSKYCRLWYSFTYAKEMCLTKYLCIVWTSFTQIKTRSKLILTTYHIVNYTTKIAKSEIEDCYVSN